MPFPFSKSKKHASSSPEISTHNQPLMYAQPSYAPSEKDSVVYSPPTIRPVTHKAISTDVFADVTYFKEQQAKAAAAAKSKADADAANKPNGLVDDAEAAEATEKQDAQFERPATPVQGSRTIPWESYHDLPADHPVFLYPDDVREGMYKKGIDPVVRAMADRALYGKKYGEKNSHRKNFSKRGLRMVGNFGNMSIGSM